MSIAKVGRLCSFASLLALAACASRYGDVPPDVSSAPLAGNATVRAISYFAGPTAAELAAKAPPGKADKSVPLAALAPAAKDKSKRRAVAKLPASRTAAPGAAEPPTARAVSTVSTVSTEARQRYQYTVELDSGGFQTLTSYQNQGLSIYDRVQIEGQKLTALRGD